MDNKNRNRPDFKETFENFEIKPSPQLWERIVKADPKPVAKPITKNALLIGGTALVIITTVILFLYYSTERSNVEFVADVKPEKIAGIVDDAAATPDKSEDSIAQDEAMKESPETKPVEEISLPPKVTEYIEQKPSQDKDKKEDVIKNRSTNGITMLEKDMPDQIQHDQPSVSRGSVTKDEVDDADTKTPVEEPQTPVMPTTPEEETETHSEKRLQVFIPGAFVPNNDGVNDIFLPVIQDNAEVFDYRMQIFSRNGLLLFESTNIDIGWDGRYQGAIVEDPVSVYVISFSDVHGNQYLERGTVTIIMK